MCGSSSFDFDLLPHNSVKLRVGSVEASDTIISIANSLDGEPVKLVLAESDSPTLLLLLLPLELASFVASFNNEIETNIYIKRKKNQINKIEKKPYQHSHHK